MAIDDKTKDFVWGKGVSVPNNDPKIFRKDQCGAWIKYSDYGNRNSVHGWEIDHIKPTSNGGLDALSNLRPLHWKNNTAKSNGNLVCVVKANGTKNDGV